MLRGIVGRAPQCYGWVRQAVQGYPCRPRGSGHRTRSVPLWPQTFRVLKQWFRLLQADGNALAFSLAAIGIVADALDRLFRHGVKNAIPKCLDLARKHVTPHVIRHTTAMRLLQAEVDIAVLRSGLDTKAAPEVTAISEAPTRRIRTAKSGTGAAQLADGA